MCNTRPATRTTPSAEPCHGLSIQDPVPAFDALESAAAANTAEYKSRAGIMVKEPINRFSSRTVPRISLLRLAAAMQKGTDCSDELCIMALVLMVRYCRTTGTALTLKMMHRLYVASLHLAIKTHSDRYFRNDTYAMMAGISTTELNLLESVLLGGLEWRCLVEASEATEFVAAPVAFVAGGIPAACYHTPENPNTPPPA